MSARKLGILWTVVGAGALVLLCSAYYLFQDWSALNRAFEDFDRAAHHRDAAAIATNYDYQSIYRINCFAEGVGALLGMVIMAIGIVGLCLMKTSQATQN